MTFDEKFSTFCEIFAKFNAVHNLSNYKNLNIVLDDSLAAFKDIQITATSAIDVGSGAGFPAVFLAMKFENTLFHLFEPNAKKASFLSYIKTALNLENIVVCCEKIQESKAFIAELITSRAAFKVADLLRLCAGFYDENSLFVLYKGSSYKDEITSLNAEISVKKGQKERNYLYLKGVKC